MTKLAILDGDIIAYRCATMASEDVDWGDGLDGVTINHKSARTSAIKMATNWVKPLGTKESGIVVAFTTPGSNFRRHLGGSYKEARTDEKPEAYWSAVEALEETYRSVKVPFLEADDLMGIVGSHPEYREFTTVVTIDKDLQGVPCRVFNPTKDTKPRVIREADANYFWLTQVLTGDAIDGYFGVPNVGPLRAEKILGETRHFLSMWARVVEAYEKKGLGFPDALRTARMARILRHTDFDFDTQEIILWHPASRAPERFPLCRGQAVPASIKEWLR